jgi:hypothetical protein
MSKLWLPKPLGRRPRFTRLENELLRKELDVDFPEHILELLDKARELRGPFEPRLSMNTWHETLYSSTVSETALTAAAEAVVFPASSQPGIYGAIPGGYMVPHRTLKLRIAGQMTIAVTTPGTFLWRLRWGGVAGTALVASGGAGATGTALTPLTTGFTNIFWEAEFYVNQRGDVSSATAGSLLATGYMKNAAFDAAAVRNMVPFPATAPAAVGSLDTTTTKDLAFTHTPSLTTASIQGMQYLLSSLN